MKYLIDTAKIISEGVDTTIYQDFEVVVTSHTLLEIQNKGLKIDSSCVSIISSPVFSDFKLEFRNSDISFYIWSNSTKTLQLIKYENKSYIPALCGKHDSAFQISIIGEHLFNQPSFFLCKEILDKDADFSQITALLLYDDIKPMDTPDDCLSISLNKIFHLKNNSTNLCP